MANSHPIPKHKRFKDLTGMRFHRWSVRSFAGMKGTEGAHWNCVCDCGAESEVQSGNLRSGKSKSCGCFNLAQIRKRNSTHGLSRTPEYNAWLNMNKRCYNENDPRYKWYGARGIFVCPEWRHDFAQFLRDMGPKPSPKHSIDRINNDGNYEPRNCRWATWKQQQNNRRPRGTAS